ncbi:GGDEF domain-containing protein [Clostridioides sp. ZZV14-6104]|nr:GGDEF domain-containing protein [Clostridioides sp. ZZV14-6104]
MKYYIFLAIAIISIIEFCNIYICRILSAQNKTVSPYKNYKSIFLIKPLIFLIMMFTKLPLPLFYILFHLMNHKAFLINNKNANKYFISNMSVISFYIFHLITLSVISLLENTSLYTLYMDTYYRLISILIAYTLIFILLYCIDKIKEHVFILVQNNIELNLFSKFIWFAIGYILFDSIQVILSPPKALTSYFIIGSNILLALQIIIFINHIYSIEKNIYLEKEHHKLEITKYEQLLGVDLLNKKANIDDLTSAYTRKFAFEKMQSYIDNKLLFSLVYIDLDKLKTINDTYGHLAGDSYIISFSNIVIDNLRTEDIFARIGGDEFIVIMPQYSENITKEVMDKIRNTMKNQISFSYGIVEVSSKNKMTLEEIINTADIRMYTDKQNNHRKNKN